MTSIRSISAIAYLFSPWFNYSRFANPVGANPINPFHGSTAPPVSVSRLIMTDQIVIRDWQLNIDADMVLRGQGADPAMIRARKPRLAEIAERAVREGLTLIKPAVVYRFAQVESVRHERLIFAAGAPLSGPLIVQHLAPARYVAVIVCTVGAAIDNHISALMPRDPAYALALDGLGSVAVEALSAELCVRLEKDAARMGHCASVPISPGMVGWPVEVGQPQIFSNLDAAAIGVTLNDSAQMIPRKSISLVLGFASTPFEEGTPCDFCALRNTCRYQHHA